MEHQQMEKVNQNYGRRKQIQYKINIKKLYFYCINNGQQENIRLN